MAPDRRRSTRSPGCATCVGDLAVGPDGPRFAPDLGRAARPRSVLLRAAGAAPGRPHPAVGLVLGARPRPGRTSTDAGWAGSLTFCRELSLVDDVLVSRPVAELDRLRREPLPLAPDQPFAAAAFDVELDRRRRPGGAVVGRRRRRAAGRRGRPIAPAPVVPPRILVDGSMVEVFDGGPTPFTTRAYPTATSRWLLRTARPAALRAWHLGPGPNGD